MSDKRLRHRTARRFLLRLAALVIVWVALWGSPTLGNLLSGLVAALVVTALFPTGPGRLEDRHEGRLRPLRALVFLGHFLVELIVSTVDVALAVVFPRRRVREAVVVVPLRSTSPVIGTVVANAISLTPGTLTVDATTESDGRIRLLVHVLGLDDPDSVRAAGHRFERNAVAAFGSREDRNRLEHSGEI